jgi:sterol desaturase/sphingolipid hydroxylase (fatty acid hydroxylase superfamily)
MTRLITLAIALVVAAAVFWVIERTWPSVRDADRVRTGRRTDVAYYFLNATVTRFASGVLVAIIVIATLRAFGVSVTVDQLRGVVERDTIIKRQPVALQAVELIIVADFIGYWMHRAFHFQPAMWRYHAIHHSSRQVDWLASVRVHPLNDVVTNLAQAVPLLLLGFSGATLGGYAALLVVLAILLHANVGWTWGPLRYVVASPVFHRWHHTTEKQGIDKNFAGLLPVWDLVFGTFYMPAGEQPLEFGVLGEKVPEGIWRQLLYPLKPGATLIDG